MDSTWLSRVECRKKERLLYECIGYTVIFVAIHFYYWFCTGRGDFIIIIIIIFIIITIVFILLY